LADVSTQHLVETVAERTGLVKAQTKQAVNAVTEVLTEQLVGGNCIQLSGFGSFDIRDRVDWQGISPRRKRR
jgi:DNA-binding protein HU-beta